MFCCLEPFSCVCVICWVNVESGCECGVVRVDICLVCSVVVGDVCVVICTG
jgi:hypothetical protein